MADALLGETFDIHGGGNDLMFPHHENEIAQSCCAHPDKGFARIWMHNEMLQVEGKKMSKSLGNFFTVRDLLDQGIPGEVIRFVFLSTHYGKPMDWTARKAEEAEKVLRRWRGMTDGVEAGKPDPAVVDALTDDLNTAGAIAELHRIAGGGDAGRLKGSAALLGLLEPGMGEWVQVDNLSAEEINLVEQVAEAWKAARDRKDFASADLFRSFLQISGIATAKPTDEPCWFPSDDVEPFGWLGLSKLVHDDAVGLSSSELNELAAERGIQGLSKDATSLVEGSVDGQTRRAFLERAVKFIPEASTDV
jgi:cysteinyl-tRNA synthetase